MGALRFWLCLVLLVLVISCSDSRPLPPTLSIKGDDKSIMEHAEKIIKARMQDNVASRSLYDVFDRYSPGGPDPHHH
ncbi:hypothetical protein RND81_09G011900 [Saponaria officinalis]|uniref:CLAVATA3/ESR (CLE)-related protein n=1 Tax=Saponaria officinalis TaxID=3572 RepID=A0AAW1IHH0_SAPOF